MGLILATIKIKVSKPFLMKISFLVLGISFLMICLASNLVVIIFSLFLAGSAIIAESSSRRSFLMEKIAHRVIGRAESLNWMVYCCVSTGFTLLTGRLGDLIGDRGVFLMISLLLGTVFLISLFALKEEEKIGTADKTTLSS